MPYRPGKRDKLASDPPETLEITRL
jgi:hypothetical protein